jgi:CRISPR-associated protein Cmr3
MLISKLPHSSGKFTYSSSKDPCPVCGRTKDKDCRWNDICHCRTYAKEHLGVGEVIHGNDGRQWAYLGDSDGGRWAMFKPHEDRRKDDWDPKLTSFSRRANNKNGNAASAKPIPAQPVAAPASSLARPTTDPSTASKAPRPKGKQGFVYRDADGQPVVLVRREDDGQGNKTFHQFRYENGEWVSRLNEQVTKRVRLYRIAEARALSEKTGHPIFLVEGEGCVERLLELGIPATTSLGGARKWSGYGGPNYLQDLQGCRIILSPDADRPGLAHMLEIERSLRQHGIEIAGWLLAPPNAPWENLPDGGGLDVVDWLESGATAEEILAAIRVALPDHLAAEDEIGDLAAEVNELAQLDRASGLTLLPKDLDTPLRRIAERLNLPVEPYYLVLLCVAASLISSQTRLVLDPGSDFEVPPILWGGLVGETGCGKSHIINTLAKPLKSLQAEHHIRYQHQLEDYKAALREYEKKKKGEDAGDPPERPRLTTLYASNYTMEAISQILSQQPDRGLLISPDELTAFLRSMNAYRGGKGADRSHWLSLYNSDSLRVDRKTSDPIFVPYPSVSVVGGIQPSILQKFWQEDKDLGDGFWARFAWVKVPLVPRSRARRGATHNPRQLLESVYRRMQAFPPMQHSLDEEGWQLWNEWECEFDEPLLTEPDERIRGTLPKALERAARIALILHWLDAACAGVTPAQIIPAGTLARAIEFTRWLQNQTRLIYGELGESSSPEASLVLRFVGRFKGCGPISLKRCRSWWSGRRKPPMKEIRNFLDGVVQMGYARWVDPQHQHIEVIQTKSGSHRSHLVTQEAETLVQSDSEQVTTRSHLVVTGSHPAATPNDKPTQSGPTGCAGESEDRPLPGPNEAEAVHPASNGKPPQPVTGGDPIDSKTVEPEPPPLPSPPVDDATSTPQVHNAGADGQRVRFLDRDPVPPPLRGREAQLERETYRTAVVWVGGKRQRVPKDWLVEGSSTPALEEREPEPPPIPRPPADDDAPITEQDWEALKAACRKAGMFWLPSLQFIAESIGIPVGKLNPAQLTQRQYRQVMERLQNFRSSS